MTRSRERLALGRPVAVPQVARRRLGDDAHDVARPRRVPSTSSGSTRLGIVASSQGSSLARPYFAASAARSRYADRRRDDEPPAEPRRSIARRRSPRSVGSAAQREVDLRGHTAGRAGCRPPSRAPGPSVAGSTRPRRVVRGSRPLTTTDAVDLLAAGEHDAGRAVVAVADGRRPRPMSGSSRPLRSRAASSARDQGARPSPRVDGLAGGPTDADRVGQEVGGRAGIAGPESGVADAAGREQSAQALVGESVLGPVGDRLREHSGELAAVPRVEAVVAPRGAQGCRRRRRSKARRVRAAPCP